jgi:hypothetical protein
MKSAVSSSPEATGRTGGSSFKAERVQLAPGAAGKQPASSEKARPGEPVRLEGAPDWWTSETRKFLLRTYELESGSRACALAGAVGSLFGERRKGSVSVVRGWLTVRVESPLSREIARGEIQFARRVDRLIEEFRKGWESR